MTMMAIAAAKRGFGGAWRLSRLWGWAVAAVFVVAGPDVVRAQQAEAEGPYAAIWVRVNGVAVTALDVMDTMPYVVQKEFPGPIPDDPELIEYLQFASVREQVIAQLALADAKTLTLSAPRDAAQRNIDNYLAASGLRETQLRPAVRRLLETDALIDLILARRGYDNTPPPAMVREFYRKNRMTHFRDQTEVVVRHIYLTPGLARDLATVRNDAERLRAECAALPSASARAARFAELAQRNSQDNFAERGGLIRLSPDPEGYFLQEFGNRDNAGEALFPEAVYRAIVNFTGADQLSPVALSERGVHLLYCEKVRGGRIRPFSEAQPMIMFYLERARRQQNIQNWLRDRHRKSIIFWNDGSPYSIEDLIPAKKAENNERGAGR